MVSIKISNSRKNVLVNAALVCGSMVLCLLVMEGSLRLFGVYVVRNVVSAHVFDEALGWRPRPGSVAVRSKSFGMVATYFNDDGLVVGPEDWNTPPDRRSPSIALIGDSFLEGYYLPHDQTFAGRFARSMRDRQVLNLGVAGYGPAQYLLRAREILPKYNVTHIIVIFFATNDVPFVFEEKFFDYPKPRFDELLRPVNLPLIDTGVGTRRRMRSSALFNMLRAYHMRLFPKRLEQTGDYGLPMPQYRLAMRLLDVIRWENPSARFDVVYLASPYEYTHDAERQANKQIFIDFCNWLLLSCHYPLVFETRPLDVWEMYIPRDGHFTARASALFAEHLSEIAREATQ